MATRKEAMALQKSEAAREMDSAMAALAALNLKGRVKEKKGPPTKKKTRKTGKGKKVSALAVEAEEFEYSWPGCCCGMNHPPVPGFKQPDGKTCTFYWQIADVHPFLTIYRVLTTEMKFLEADTDDSGVIELPELKLLLGSILGKNLSDRTVDRTFHTIDTDGSGTLDFLEVLGIVDTLIQRRETNLPETVQNDYSKVCSIQ